jgi:hypothetical protein
MNSTPVALAVRASPVSGLTVLLAAAFAIGTLTGLALHGVLDRPSGSAGAAGNTFTGVADNNMSDAARRATDAAIPRQPTFRGVAENNMSDAARRAIDAASRAGTGTAGVAENNMSDAARRAVHPDAR